MPSEQELIKLLGGDDFFLWEYYGKGILGKIQAWMFRSRLKVITKFLRQAQLQPRAILDVGSGPMFISYVLVNNAISEYIGVDIMHADRLKKYKDAMRNLGVKKIEAIRASAESLPLRNESFDFALSLDVLEHLSKPKEAAMEISRVVKDDGMVAISLPLENFFQKACRIGFVLMKSTGDSTLKRIKSPSIIRTPEYHYAGDAKSYDSMAKILKILFKPLITSYTPIGFHKSINVNAIHILQKNG